MSTTDTGEWRPPEHPPEPPAPAPPPEPTEVPAPRRPSAVKLGLIGFALFAGGVALGSLVATPAEDLDEVKADLAAAEAQVQVLSDERGELADRETKLVETETSLQAKERELADREAAVGAVEAARDANGFSDGVHEVGVDIQPGRYKTSGGPNCYWEKTDATGDIIDNDLPGGAATINIERTVFTFKSSNCGTWQKVG